MDTSWVIYIIYYNIKIIYFTYKNKVDIPFLAEYTYRKRQKERMIWKKKCNSYVVRFVCADSAVADADQCGISQKEQKSHDSLPSVLSQDQIQWSEWTSIPSSDVLFATADINKDGVKELIVRYVQASHMDGWHRIYTYKKGRVKSLGHFTNVYIYKNKNFFVDSYANTGVIQNSYYRLGKNGKRLPWRNIRFQIRQPPRKGKP